MSYITQRNILGLLMVCASVTATATLNAQVVIGQPSLEFSRACASDSFNTYETTFIFSPPSALSDSNTFTVELSNGEGDFTDAIAVFTSEPGEITTSPASIFFSIPRDTAGENYRIRIKSSSPEATSAPSASFAAYFKLHDTPFTINDLVSTGTFCPGTGFLLTIDNPAADGSVSPLSFPSLSFNWFKVIDDTNATLIAQGETFQVTEEGTYFAETNYGSCPSDSFSNRVTITFATSDEPANANITSSLGTPFCTDGAGTTLTTVAGDSYQWFRDDQLIQGASGNSIQTNESGNYAVIVTTGDCVAVGSLEVVSLAGTTTIDVPAVNFIEAGGSLTATVTTSLDAASFQWFLNNEPVEGATGDSFTTTAAGNYKVAVTATGACDFTTELFFEIQIVIDTDSVPNVVSPNGDGINDTWAIPAEYLGGTGTEIVIYTSNGTLVLETDDYTNNWPASAEETPRANQIFYYMITPVGQEPLMGSITLVR